MGVLIHGEFSVSVAGLDDIASRPASSSATGLFAGIGVLVFCCNAPICGSLLCGALLAQYPF